MFSNYLKIALRLIRKNKIFSLINIIGLAIGIASCILILLFVQFELSFDQFHENADQIYRLVLDRKMPTHTSQTTKTSSWIAPQIVQEFPEILNFTGMFNMGYLISSAAKKSNEAPLFVDPAFLKIFSFPLIQGNVNTVLENPHNILISEDIAEKYFGEKNPLGKIVTINNEHDFTVTGVLKNVLIYSHFRFDILCSFNSLQSLLVDQRKYDRSYTYFLLDKNADYRTLETKIRLFLKENRGERYAATNILHLQPLLSIYLNSHRSLGLSNNCYIYYSYILTWN